MTLKKMRVQLHRNPVGQPQEVEGYLNHLTDTNRHYGERGDVVVAEVLLRCQSSGPQTNIDASLY